VNPISWVSLPDAPTDCARSEATGPAETTRENKNFQEGKSPMMKKKKAKKKKKH
jgi:hypothetical protein